MLYHVKQRSRLDRDRETSSEGLDAEENSENQDWLNPIVLGLVVVSAVQRSYCRRKRSVVSAKVRLAREISISSSTFHST